MISRAQRLIVSFVVCIPVLVMLALGVVHFANQVNRTISNSGWVLIDELSRQFGREVRVGRVRVTPLGTLVMENVRVAEGKTLANGTILAARRVSVRYDLNALIFHAAKAGSVRSVQLTDAHVLVIRRSNGTFNILELFRHRPGPPGPPFLGKVIITNAMVVYRDYVAGTPGAPVSGVASHVNAAVDAAGAPQYLFSLSARGQAGVTGPVMASGSYDDRGHLLRMDASARQLSARFASHYMGLPKGVSVLRGTLAGTAGVEVRFVPNRRSPSITGVATIADASVAVPGLREPVTGIGGRVVMIGERIAANLSWTAARSSGRISGTVVGLRQPMFNVSVTSSNVRFHPPHERRGRGRNCAADSNDRDRFAASRDFRPY